MINAGGQSRFSRAEVDAWMEKKGRKAGGQRVSVLDILKGDLDPTTKRIVFMAILTRELEKEGFSPVACGNYAIELYTSGGYKAECMDIVAPTDLVDKVLSKLDFKKEDDSWKNEDVSIAVNVLAEDLEEHKQHRVNQIDVSGYPAYLLGIEDLIIDKLKDFVFSRESAAISWVQELIEIHVNEIDWDYLNSRATEIKVIGALQEILLELGLQEEDE